MSCVREASPPLPGDPLRHDLKKRRFLQPLRGLRRIFRRKGRPVISTTSDTSVDVGVTLRSKENFDTCEEGFEVTNLEPAKSHSTSQLADDHVDNSQRRSLQSTLLSVSHDSVFTSEQRTPDSGSETSLYVHTRLGFPHSSVRAELFEAVRRRRVQENNVSDEEDLGLPRSPISNSPTTGENLFTKENIVTKSSQSTCSDGSLLSMGSSEIDEECYQSSRHSSKLSLYEKRVSATSDSPRNSDQSTNLSGDASSLCHSAAKHKMAIKPKRKHGAPHKKRQIITSNTLPTTPELNEENNLKNCSVPKENQVADIRHCDEHDTNQNYACKIRTEHHTNIAQVIASQSKCCSPPPDILLSPSPSFKLLTKIKSNTASQPNTSIYDDVAPDEKDTTCKREDGAASFFSRLLLRRSSKKKKITVEETETTTKEVNDTRHRERDVKTNEHVSLSYVKNESAFIAYVNGGLTNAVKHHPMFRQRVEPLSLSNVENFPRTTISYSSTVPVNMANYVATVDLTSIAETDKRNVRKSYSFRNNEKLPYTQQENGTPSLPVNIGLFEYHHEDSTKFSKQLSKTDERICIPDCDSTDEYEVISPIPDKETRKMKPTTESLEYNNVLTSSNTLNINVNDESELIQISANEMNDLNTKSTLIYDGKMPIPAPRTSLLNKTPSIKRLIDDNDKMINNENDVNVTISENIDGRKSIISIGSRPSVTSSDIGIDESIFSQSNFGDETENILSTNSLSEDEYFDEVFTPINESIRVESLVDASVESNKKVASESSLQITNCCEVVVQAETTEHNIFPVEITETAQLSSISICDEGTTTKPDKIEEESINDKQEFNPTIKSPVTIDSNNTSTVRVNDAVVVMRKKNAREMSLVKDEEPELMKVFARRSLKLKETDNVEEILEEVVKSRDSDKENEDANSPVEDRKKKDEVPDLPPGKLPFVKFQRSISHDVVLATNVNEKRQRCKSIPNDLEKNGQSSLTKEKINISHPVEEKTIPFKRIQQRREEWEKRAQQAMKVHSTK